MPDLAPFRRRLAAMPFGFDFPVWIDDPDLCIRSHVHRIGAPAPGSDQVLAGLVAQIASQPLEGLAEGRVALVFKIHHAVADGVSAIQLLLQLLDPSPEGPEACGSHERVRSDPAPTGRALLAHALSRLPSRERLARWSAGPRIEPECRCPSADPARPGTGRHRPSERWRMEERLSPT
jgi:hypothetical protein